MNMLELYIPSQNKYILKCIFISKIVTLEGYRIFMAQKKFLNSSPGISMKSAFQSILSCRCSEITTSNLLCPAQANSKESESNSRCRFPIGTPSAILITVMNFLSLSLALDTSHHSLL